MSSLPEFYKYGACTIDRAHETCSGAASIILEIYLPLHGHTLCFPPDPFELQTGSPSFRITCECPVWSGWYAQPMLLSLCWPEEPVDFPKPSYKTFFTLINYMIIDHNINFYVFVIYHHQKTCPCFSAYIKSNSSTAPTFFIHLTTRSMFALLLLWFDKQSIVIHRYIKLSSYWIGIKKLRIL